MNIQDQYITTVRQTQEAWANAIESLTGDVQALTKSTNPAGRVDPNAAIDQIFDFWVKTLETQREGLKQLVGGSVALSESVRSHADQVGSVIREQAESTKQAAQDQADSADRAERDKVVAKYDDLTKAELQDELSSRDLPKTGNVDELRERLIAADLK